MEEVHGKEVIKASKRNCLVWTKSKYFVGSSGSVWASHLFENKQLYPTLHMVDDTSLPYPVEVISLVTRAVDSLLLYKQQSIERDILLICKGDEFMRYEISRLQYLLKSIERVLKGEELLNGTEALQVLSVAIRSEGFNSICHACNRKFFWKCSS